MTTSRLALDLGTTTGFCVGHTGSLISGTANFKPGRYDGGGMRFVKFRAWLNELKVAYPIEMVVFEEVRRHAGTDAAHVYGGLMATLTAWCEENNIPYEGVPVGEIKRSWTGKGNATKEAMIAEACRRGFAPIDDNEADAIALWHNREGVPGVTTPGLNGVSTTSPADDGKMHLYKGSDPLPLNQTDIDIIRALNREDDLGE